MGVCLCENADGICVCIAVSEEVYLSALARLPVPVHLYCVGDAPERTVLQDLHSPPWALKHWHIEDIECGVCPSRGGGGLSAPVRSGEVAAGCPVLAEHKPLGKPSTLQSWSSGQSRSAAAGRGDQSRSFPRPSGCSAPHPAARSRSTDGPGPKQVLQQITAAAFNF